jgi:hypothetical protein
MTSHVVGCPLETLNEVRDRLVLATNRKGEMPVVRFRSLAVWPFVHHEIPTAGLHCALESFDGVHHVQKLFGSLGAAYANAESFESIGQFAGHAPHVFVSSHAF